MNPYPSLARAADFFFILAGITALLSPAAARAQDIAELFSAEGRIEGRVAPAQNWSGISQGQKFSNSDAVRTLEQSRAGVKFATGYLLRMNEKTTITFDRQPGEDKGRMSVLQGIGHFFSRTPQEFPSINTPQVSASVRGTEFVVAVTGETTVISVLDGAVEASNQYGSVSLGKNEEAVTKTGSAPVKQILVRPTDAVQWALYYPAVFDEADFSDSTSWSEAFNRSLKAYRANNSQEALDILHAAPSPHPCGMLLLEASLELSVGQVDAARTKLEDAAARLSSAPAASQPSLQALLLSEQSVIAVVKGEKSAADDLASRALQIKSDSAAAHLALAFVRQAQFRLEEARELLEETVRLAPRNAAAQARLAEIQLGFGERDKAIAIADAALQNDPGNSYALTVRGFASLTRYETDAALDYFSRAIAADEGFAAPRLGLGLAKIRKGNLEDGRRNLEQAAALDPNVALYRSYLGKAYYEEEREAMSEHEYQRAIDLDPLDPTPYLYRAFTMLTTHRPIEALEDVQRSVSLNDNRAVFRSRLLLDQDQGTRSSSLGQIYNRLGFTELSRVEAIRALNHDYSNYSAHFLLADLYRDTQLNSRAQVTENLIGRLLSPVTFNANSINIGGEAGLNEYTTLFDRPVDRASVDGFVRSQVDEAGGRADYTLSTERLGFNLGYAGSYRGGFRENDWLRTNQIFTQGQYAITPDDTFIWDGAVTANDQGDININFDPNAEDPDFKSEFDGVLVRGGYHRRLGPGVQIIGQAFYNYGDFDGRNDLNDRRLSFLNIQENGVPVPGNPFPFDGRTNEQTGVIQNLGRGDLQLLWDTEPVSLVFGTSVSAEHLDSHENSVISDAGSEPILGFLQGLQLASNSNLEEYSTQNFIYSTWHLMPWMDFDAGLTYSWFKYSDDAFQTPFVDDTYQKDQWGPKAGILLNLTEWASLRFAYSRSLDRTGRGGLGPLEPTFVGGFNQVFDGVRGSSSDLYGTGLDIKLGLKTYAGASYQRREIDLNVPFVEGGLIIDRNGLATSPTDLIGEATGSAHVDRVNSYLYQIFGTSFSGVLDYNYERFNEDDPLPDSVTNRASTTLNYFHTSGLFAFTRATYRNQQLSGLLDPIETDDFWILDAGVGYELDHRHGAITLRFDNILDEDFHYAAIADEDPVLPRFGASLDVRFSF